jgi:hypothetical protein
MEVVKKRKTSFWFVLPKHIRELIYTYDRTFHDVFDETLDHLPLYLQYSCKDGNDDSVHVFRRVFWNIILTDEDDLQSSILFQRVTCSTCFYNAFCRQIAVIISDRCDFILQNVLSSMIHDIQQYSNYLTSGYHNIQNMKQFTVQLYMKEIDDSLVIVKYEYLPVYFDLIDFTLYTVV